MSRNRTMMVLGLLVVAGMLLAACGPKTEVTPGTVVTDVPTQPAAPKTFVVCMAQEPADLNVFTDTALVKAAVLEAVYGWGLDTRSYTYQAEGLEKVPSFSDGDAQTIEIEVTIGDTVYDAATDNVVTIAADAKISLNQADGSILVVDFAVTPTAKTVKQSVTWKLMDGLVWEDGTPVTTDDVLFAWSIASSPDSPIGKYTIERTESFTASDDKTFTWVSMPGYTSGTYFFDALINPMPKHIYGEGGSRPLTVAEMMTGQEPDLLEGLRRPAQGRQPGLPLHRRYQPVGCPVGLGRVRSRHAGCGLRLRDARHQGLPGPGPYDRPDRGRFVVRAS
jgi:peptide/nickel transport system substrate-binding protein